MTQLGHLEEKSTKKRPHMKKKTQLFHQGNEPYYISINTMPKLDELHFGLLHHSSYSSDLEPSDFYLFADLRKNAHKKIWIEIRVDGLC